MGCGGSKAAETNQIMGANGPLRHGVRVQTQWDEGSGHDNKWYCGTIQAVFEDGTARIEYDDGDSWTGKAVYIYALPPHHAGMTSKVAIGAPSMEGVPGMAPQMMAQPGYGVGPPIMGAPPPGYGAPVGMPMMGGPPPMMGGPPPGGGEVMTVTATVPGGNSMQLQGPSGVMTVDVPLGVQPGQQFQFQTGAPTMGGAPVVMAQPIQVNAVVMAQPV